MHEQVIQIISIWSNILLSSKSSQAFSEYKQSEGINSIYQHIYSHIKL